MDQFINEDLYRFIFENSNDAILLTHPDGNIYKANQAACKMLQRSEEEICQLGRNGIVDSNDPRLKAALKERNKKGKASTELNFIRSDGRIIPTHCASTIFKDAEGRMWSVIIIHDISAFKKAEEALQKTKEEVMHYASYDYLTETYNRRVFMNIFQKELFRSKRENTVLSLILLDIDYFKNINDTMGHNCGDIVLKNVARCLCEKLRPYDVLGRFGGDEFIICMPNTTCQEALTIADRIREHVEKTDMIYDNKLFSVTISIGLACNEQNINEDANSLIIRADKNMYLAKEQRNFVYGM